MPDSIVPAAISSQLDVSGEERIHMANRTTVVRPTYVPNIDDVWLAYAGTTTFRYSSDAAHDDWSNTVNTGGFVSAFSGGQRVHFAGGRLFRMGTGGTDRSRVTTNGTSFTSLTGLSFSAAVETVIKPDTEWLFFQANSNMGFSTDGVDVQTRALGATLQDGRMAIKGSTILGLTTTSNTIRRSTDNGVNWAGVSLGGVTVASGFPIATANRFLIFGQKLTDSTNFVKWSLDGSAASWTEVSIPGSFSSQLIRQAVYNPEIDRVIIVLADYSVYYSEDEGDTWIAASAFPNVSGDTFATGSNNFLFYNHKCYLRVNASDSTAHRLYTTVNGESFTQVFNESVDGSGGVFLNFAAGDF